MTRVGIEKPPTSCQQLSFPESTKGFRTQNIVGGTGFLMRSSWSHSRHQILLPGFRPIRWRGTLANVHTAAFQCQCRESTSQLRRLWFANSLQLSFALPHSYTPSFLKRELFCRCMKEHLIYNNPKSIFCQWCHGWDSNPQSLRNAILSRARIPIPPPWHFKLWGSLLLQSI